MSENTIAAPAKGDPITAAWASSVAAAVNGAQGADESPDSLRTPHGIVSPPPCAEMMGAPGAFAMPFDCRVVTEKYGSSYRYRLWVFLPGMTNWTADSSHSWENESYVYADGRAIEPSSAQTVGSTSNGWVDCGTVAHGTVYLLMLYVCFDPNFAPPSAATTALDEVKRTWTISVITSSTGSVPPHADTGFDPVCIARVYLPTASDLSQYGEGVITSAETGLMGCVQFRKGAVSIPRKVVLDSDVDMGGSLSREFVLTAQTPDGRYPREFLQLYGFNTVSQISPPAGFDIVVRNGSLSPKQVSYIRGASGSLSVGGQTVTVDGGLITSIT